MLLLALGASSVAAAKTPAPEPAGHDLVASGRRIHYVEAGSGPPVILLHALGADHRDWQGNIAALAAAGHRVIAYDMLGAGRSAKPDLDYSPATMVGVLRDVMDALKIDRASLVGHSFGGATAAAFAVEHPDRVERLVLVDAGYGYALPKVDDPRRLGHNPGTFNVILPKTEGQARALVALSLADPGKPSDPAVIRQVLDGITDSEPMADAIGRAILARRETLDGRLGGVRAPTLIVWGRRDGVTPVAMAARFASDIPGAKVEVFERSAHSPNAEEQAAFNRLVIGFLAGS